MANTIVLSMGPSPSQLIWRVIAALFLGAVIALGATAVSSPAGDVVPARFALAPAAQVSDSEGANDDDVEPEAPDEDDRPPAELTDGLSRMVGSPPAVDVEVLNDTETSEPQESSVGADDSTGGVDDGSAVDVGQTGPASQVVATPKFTG